MNPNELGRSVQDGNAESKWEQRKRKDKQAMPLYRGRFVAEKIREERELQREIGDWERTAHRNASTTPAH